MSKAAPGMSARIEPFFDPATGTVTHLVTDPATGTCAIVDSVLDFDPKSGRTGTAGAERLVAEVQARGLSLDWILETHVHADHLSAAPWLQQRLGGRIGIGAHVAAVRRAFDRVFDPGPGELRDTAPFDHLFADGEAFAIGTLAVRVLHTPGHTPACIAYQVDGADVFVGDTLFMPDSGTARCDFPGGDARALYRSVRRLLSLPDATRLHLCHDYPPSGRAPRFVCTVAEQRAGNIHVRDGIDEDAFVALRQARDATLAMPQLMLPAVQVNLRAGRLPDAEANGVRYLRIPLDQF